MLKHKSDEIYCIQVLQYYDYCLVLKIYIFCITLYIYLTANVDLFEIKSGEVPLFGKKLQLVCELSSDAKYGIEIYRTETVNFSSISPVSICLKNNCYPNSTDDYIISLSGRIGYITIRNLTFKEDQKYWTCVQRGVPYNSRNIYIQVFCKY